VALGVRYAPDPTLLPSNFLGMPGGNMKRFVIEGCEIVKATELSRELRLAHFATVLHAEGVGACAYSVPVAAAESIS
jgi:hypothetical protein